MFFSSFFFFILTFFLFLSFFFSFFRFLFFLNFSNLLPFWTLKLHCTYLLPMLRSLLVLEQRGHRDKVGTENTFHLERYLKSSIVAPSCYLPWIDDPYSTIGCGQGGNHKRWFLVLRVDIRRGLWNLRCGDTQCMDRKASEKIDTQKRNDQLLSLGPEKSRPKITQPKINLVY
jgi:hypothetical protein